MTWLLPLLPLVSGLLLWMGGKRRLLGPAALAAVLATLGIAMWGATSEATTAFWWGPQLELTVGVEGLARVMAIVIPAVAAPIVLYAVAAEADDPGLAKLVGLLVTFVGAMELLVIAADLLSLLIAWELVGAISWALIGHHWRQKDRPQRAAHAFVTTRLGDIGLYLAAGAAFAGTGSFAYADLGRAGQAELDVIAVGVLLAAAAKSAQLPFSPWLFSAMAGPTPVSALLHSATMVAAGAYALTRLAPEFTGVAWFGPLTIAIGITTAIAGGLVALVQTDFKKALAASTSAQYGLMFAAIGAGSVAAAGLHLVTQAAFKSLLFLVAGVALNAAGTGRLSKMGFGRTMPVVALFAGVGTLALAAVPPMGGAFSKEAVLAASVEAGPWAGAGVVLAGLISALYAARLHLLAFGPGTAVAPTRAPGRSEVAAMALLAGATLAMSALWLPGGRGLVERFGGSELVTGSAWELPTSIASIASAFAASFWLQRRGRLAALGLNTRAQRSAEDWLGLPTLARVAVADPVLGLARALARFDDRVVDAGSRAVAAVAGLTSRTFSWWGERRLDGMVWGVAGGTLAAAHASRVVDDRDVDGVVQAVAGSTLVAARASRAVDERGVDAMVEGLAGAVGLAGRRSRKLQSGLTHHYYVIIAVGLVGVFLVAALGR